MKYIISTLGCKVNQYETQAMEGFLNERGFERAVPGEIADAVIVNTCAVTAESGRKSRQTIRRLRDENPGAVLAVCGCYSQIEPDAVSVLGADVIFGAADREKLVDAVVRACEAGEKTRDIDEPFKRREIERLPAGAVDHRTRAMLKIQDGCAVCHARRPQPRRQDWTPRATAKSSSPASRSPPTAWICPESPALPT